MQITETKNEKLKRNYDIKVEAEKVKKLYDAKLNDLMGKVKIQGFRQGKVPAKIVKAKYGQDIMAEVLEGLISSSMKELYEEKKIAPALQPKVEIKSMGEDKDLDFSVEMEIMPEVPEVDFAKLKLTKVFSEVTDEDVAKEIARVAEAQGKDTKADDELAKKFGQKSLDDLKKLIKAEMEKEYENVAQNHLKRAMLDAFAESYKFGVPEAMVAGEFDAIWAEAEKEAKAAKKELTDKDKKEYQDIAERRVRLGLLLTKLGEREKVKVEAPDINRMLIAEARAFPGQEKALFDFYQKNARFRESINATVFEGKVVEHILGKAEITPKKVEAEKLFSWYDEDGKHKD